MSRLMLLRDICEFRYGKSLPEALRIEGAVPVFGSNGRVGLHVEPLTSGPTIVIGRKGSFGEINYSNEACWPIDTTYFIDKEATSADLRWLFHLLRTLKLNRLNRAAAVPGLNREDAYRKRVRVPSFDEQRRIAAILDQAEELRAKRRAAIALLDELPQAIFLDMFGDPVTNTKDWPRVAIESLVQNITNWNPAKQSQEFEYIDISSIDSATKEIVSIRQIAASDAPSRARQRIQAGDVLVSTVRPNLNAVALVRNINETGTASTGFCVLRASPERAVSAYLFSWVRSKAFIESMTRQATGASYPAVTDRIVKSFEVFDAPLDLQRQFAARVEAVHRAKAAHQRALAELDALFASLQWWAFEAS